MIKMKIKNIDLNSIVDMDVLLRFPSRGSLRACGISISISYCYLFIFKFNVFLIHNVFIKLFKGEYLK